MKPSTRFDKYATMGAYHWKECDHASRQYNPPLEARYAVVVKRVRGARRVVDVGAGDGFLMGLLAPEVGSVVGVEPEPLAVELAAEQLRAFPNCRVTVGTGYDLPFRSGTFDTVTLTDVIEHMETPEVCLREAWRVLQPGGRLVLTTPKQRPDRVWDRLHVREYRPEELLACVRASFEAVEVRFFCPVAWYRIYATRVGHPVMRWWGHHVFNPYGREGHQAADYYQMVAVCEKA